MRNEISFRLEIIAGKRHFAVTQEEKAVLDSIGHEMSFSTEVMEKLPPREDDSEGGDGRELVRLDLPVEK